MQGIIKQLEACHKEFDRLLNAWNEGVHMNVALFRTACDTVLTNRALIDRLKAIPTWHMSVDEMAAMTPEGE